MGPLETCPIEGIRLIHWLPDRPQNPFDTVYFHFVGSHGEDLGCDEVISVVKTEGLRMPKDPYYCKSCGAEMMYWRDVQDHVDPENDRQHYGLAA